MPLSNAGRRAEFHPPGGPVLMRHWNGVPVNSRPARAGSPSLPRIPALPGRGHCQGRSPWLPGRNPADTKISVLSLVGARTPGARPACGAVESQKAGLR